MSSAKWQTCPEWDMKYLKEQLFSQKILVCGAYPNGSQILPPLYPTIQSLGFRFLCIEAPVPADQTTMMDVDAICLKVKVYV
ncbi:hypothetical protein T08_15065 [Trichinella sp. T8]|nr:hypothetical protein T08_15065 [Trichinella sp. T8]